MNSFPISLAQLAESLDVAAVRHLGLETMTGSFQAAFSRDTDHDRLSVFDTKIRINELGTVMLAGEFTNVARGSGLLAAASLARARLRYDDASLVDRLLHMDMTQDTTATNALHQRLSILAKSPAEAFGEDNREMAEAGRTIGDFIRSPHSLTIELMPPTPFPLGDLLARLNHPDALPPALGLTVNANTP